MVAHLCSIRISKVVSLRPNLGYIISWKATCTIQEALDQPNLHSEFQASKGYIVNSRPVRATW